MFKTVHSLHRRKQESLRRRACAASGEIQDRGHPGTCPNANCSPPGGAGEQEAAHVVQTLRHF